jgi:hypothetical protein
MPVDAPADALTGGPADPAPLPDELARQLLRVIESRVGRCIADFKVYSWSGRGLIVSGRTHRFFAKQVAQHVAAQVTGLCVFANRIAVSRAEDSSS